VIYKINTDTDMCKGEAPDGTMICGYRERCLRYKATPNDGQFYEEFFRAGDDCAQYLSLSTSSTK
jgi:hypothetical protein